MKVSVDTGFEKDLRNLRDSKALLKALDLVRQFERAKSLSEIKAVKKLKGDHDYYRQRSGNYRIGFSFKNNEIVLLRFLHRKEIYRYFP